MPAAITAALIAAGLTAGEAAFVLFIGKLVLTYAVSAMLTDAKKGYTQRPPVSSRNTVTEIDPAATWKMVYGRVRKGGSFVFRGVTSDNKQLQQEEFTLRDGGGVYTVPESFVFDSDAGAEFYDQYDVDGTPNWTITPLTSVSSLTPGPGEYNVTGRVYTFNTADVADGHYVRVRFYRFGEERGRWFHGVLALAYGESEEISEIWFNDEIVPLDSNGSAIGRHANYAIVKKHLGTAGDVAEPLLLEAFPGVWTDNCRLAGHTYLYLRFYKGNDSPLWNATGFPNVSVVMKGRKVFDPRTGLTEWSDNAALCAADYMHDPLGFNAEYSTIADAELIAAANLCDEAVTLAAGGTEARYTCNGIIDTADPRLETLGRLLASFSGKAVYVGGEWRLHGGAYNAPVATITESDLTGPVTIRPKLSASETFSGIKGLYADEVNKFQPAGFPPVGVAPFRDVSLQFTNSPSMAQRIAMIELRRSQYEKTVALPLRLRAYEAEPPETIALNLSRYGFVNAPFELTEMTLKFGDAIELEVSARETGSAIYDWTVGDETTVDVSPSTALPNPFIVLPPGAPTVTEEIYEIFGFGVGVKAIITWPAAPDAQAYRYELQWRKSGAIDWNEQTGLVRRNAEIENVTNGGYSFRVRAISSLGVTSVWVQTDVVFVGLTAPPGDVLEFSVIKIAGNAYAQCAAAADLDVRKGGVLVVRHTPEATAAVWEDGIVYDEFPGASLGGMLPLVSGTYMAKWRDSSGQYSTGTATYVLTEEMLSGWTTVATSTQASGFTGSKTNITLDGTLGGIRITTVPGSGEYLFAAHMDLTTVATRRFEADINSLVYDPGDLFDSTELFDGPGDYDGISNLNDADATLYARATDDNPSGSPVWGPWTPFFVAEFTCRALQFKLVLNSTVATQNIVISTLTVHAKVPV